MAVYFVALQEGATSVEERLRELASGSAEYYKVSPTEFLVSLDGTTKEVSDKLGITVEDKAVGIVVAISNYYGRAPADVWEWLKREMERQPERAFA